LQRFIPQLMKKCIGACILLFAFIGANAQKLSDRATISVITCGPFQGELYSAFGHSAFRVYDPDQNIDAVFNYGVFDFDQPNFYLNFARGYLYYKLAAYDYQRFESSYIYYNRSIHDQELNLTSEQKQKLFDYLMWNRKPENENYRYDYFYNNCATKIRDVVVTALGKDVVFDGSYVKTDYTIRQLTDLYLKQQPWGDLGIDICLGLPMDKKASPYEYMFLPDYIESGFDHATIQQNGTVVPLVKAKVNVYDARPEEIAGGLPHPMYVFGAFALLCVAITAWDFKRGKPSTWLDSVLFIVTGLLGFLLFFLWFFTDHQAAAKNFNLLWALPTNLIAAVALFRRPEWLKKYFLGVTLVSALLLLTWPILPQQLHTSLIPIVVAILIRAFTQYKLWKK